LKIGSTKKLPRSWESTALDCIVEVNPKLDKTNFEDDLDVSFVPMPAVEPETGHIDVAETRKFSDVKKGYTAFRERDVLFAKITPCMENGKMAVVPFVKNDLGFGSTEFHVLRSYSGISPEYVYYYVSAKLVRIEAEHNMTGAVGQRRVPAPWLSATDIPLPPTNEQRRIVAKIEELLSELDKGIENLKTAWEQLKVYRQALLKHAYEGKLTEQWRKDNADMLETAEQLLEKIQKERFSYIEEKISDGDKEAKLFLSKIKKNIAEYPDISPPPGARWVNLLEICSLIVDCHNKTAPYQASGIHLIRTPCIRDGKIQLNEEARFVSDETFAFWSRRCPPEPGDVIFTREAPMGEAGIVPDGMKLCMGQRMMLMRPPKYIDSRYLLYAFMEPVFCSRMTKDSVGTGVKHLRVGDVEKLCIPLFPIEEREQIVSILDTQLSVLDEQVTDIEDNLQRCEALRQSILKKAFSGQLVPQDPNDEPAIVLIERIADEKAEAAAKAKPAKKKQITRKAS